MHISRLVDVDTYTYNERKHCPTLSEGRQRIGGVGKGAAEKCPSPTFPQTPDSVLTREFKLEA